MPGHIKLADGEDLHDRSPATFEIPNAYTRYGLRVGDFAKLVFLPDDDETAPERMWVVVTDVHAVGYVGKLANTPVEIDLVQGDSVAFTGANVIGFREPPASAPPGPDR